MNESIGDWVDPKSLKPWDKNPRKNDSAVAKVAASIQKYGFASPIVARPSDMRVIAGHTRLKAALKLKLDRVPVRFVDLTDAQAAELTVADNKLGEIAEWDGEALGALLRDLPVQDFGDLGWSADDLEEVIPDWGTPEKEIDAEPQIDRAEELRVKWRVERGQLWALGDHRLMCGDSTNPADVKKAFDGLTPEIMVTDPPYGVEYDPAWRNEVRKFTNAGKQGVVLNDDRADWQAAWELFPGSVAYVYHAGAKAGIVQTSLEKAGFVIRSQIIWVKDCMALSRGDYHWQHEPCWYAVKEKHTAKRNDDRSQTTVWNIPARDDTGHGHGTQKPVECMARAIRNHEFDYVYEPFSGSGTTIIACEQLGKTCCALELSPGYVAVALQRWADATGKKPRLLK